MVNQHWCRLSLLLAAIPVGWCPAAAPVAKPVAASAIETARAALRTRQFTAAQERLHALAIAGDGEAQYLLGQMLLNGVGAPVNLKAAQEWLEQAARQKHAAAAYVLARFVWGRGIRKYSAVGG